MHGGHAHARLSFKPPSVPASPPVPSSALDPLSPLSDLSSSPSLLGIPSGARTRLASGSSTRPSQRRRDAAEHAVPPSAPTPLVRRMRPLACMASNANAIAGALGANVQAPVKEKAWRMDAWRESSVQLEEVHHSIDFPPKHVVLHPDDASNKVFLAMGRALMSVNNCAMTIKDLADLSMRYGMYCQNTSAASQAITFFIRSHLHRCEEEQDFPLLLRHVLSGTQKDDALAPALYSRTGGNVSNKDRAARDENGNLKERLTCFRRGTTVWYLSRAAGAPCPFARVGIALRDYSECSAITSVEGRKIDNDLSRGVKRKRERCLRKRAGSGPAARRDDDESDDERKPPKIKLTLRLRHCSTSMREKHDAEDSSSSSDSDSDAQDETMDVDGSERSVPQSPCETASRTHEPTWTFPPFPIQRRISIPPYTPSEETYPNIYTSPTINQSSTTFFGWPASMKPKLELACIDSFPGPSSRGHRERAPSVSFSVASPPPESDDDFGLDDDDDDDGSLLLSPEIRFKREDNFAYVWPQAAPSNSSLDLPHIKPEPDMDDHNDAAGSKRTSMQTIKQENAEELDLDIALLSLSFNEGRDLNSDTRGLGVNIKQEDDGLTGFHDSLLWGQPAELTQDEPVAPVSVRSSRGQETDDDSLQMLWRNVELLGPDTVRVQDWEDGCWEEQEAAASPPVRYNRIPFEQHDGDTIIQSSDLPSIVSASRPPSSPTFTQGSLSSPPSLAGSVRAWSDCSPETEIESSGPASPPPFAEPETLTILRNEEPTYVLREDGFGISRSSPWIIPGKQTGEASTPSRLAAAMRSEDIPDIPLSEQSAPWERGMCTEEDVEEHLLAPTQSLSMISIKLPEYTDRTVEDVSAVPEPPLSPQEEAVFQSLCMCPDMGREDKSQAVVESDVKQHTVKPVGANARRAPNTSYANVFAAATRPTMRLRERRPSKRLAELEQIRKQAEMPRAQAMEEEDNSNVNADCKVDSFPETREKGDTAASKAPLRRSKRVATAAVTQRNRERLRRRT